MKKLFALLIAAACLFSLGTAALAEGEEMVPVCVSVPEGWEAPCLWAWADDGTNAFAAWPGEEADPLGDTGWYYCYVPSFVQNIIVNQRRRGADRGRGGRGGQGRLDNRGGRQHGGRQL